MKNYPANQFIWVNVPIKNGFIHIRWLFDLFGISATNSMFQMINEKTLVVRVYRGWNSTQLGGAYFINGYKDPYQTRCNVK